MSKIIKQLERETKKRAQKEALTIPSDVVKHIQERSTEAVESGEQYKISGGWVIHPFMGKYSTRGLLEVASRELKKARLKLHGLL